MSIGGRTFLSKETLEYREPQCELWDIAKEIDSIFKWHHYYELYQERLERFRGRDLKVLEIGIHFGGSLLLWSRFFTPGSTIVGVDIDERCSRYEGGNIHVRIGDQSDAEFLKSLVDEFGKFDIIIDDGSHMSEHQRASWQYLFRHALDDDGLYVVEDAYNSYFPDMTIPGNPSFIDTTRHIVDLMHMNYVAAGNTGPFIHDDPAGHTLDVEYFEGWIKSLEYCEGIVFFRKGKRPAAHAPKAVWIDRKEHGLE